MLKIHKSHSKKLLLISITAILGISSLLGLTYYPNPVHAKIVNDNPYPPIHPNLEDITYMQDMTAEVCQNTYGHASKQLIDKRDNKTYWVTKLMDGNCWMTQNLELINKTISAEDSDFDSGTFTIPESGNRFTTMTEESAQAYYDPTYGGYYNWYTAVAGKNFYSDSTTSICPKNWSLPSGSGNKSFENLFLAYGPYQEGTLFYGNQNITDSPINLRFGGEISGNSVQGAGSTGYYWIASYLSRLKFDTSVTLSYKYGSWIGVPIRCVAKGEPIIRPEVTHENNVSITINPTISLDVVNEVEVKKSDTNPSTAAFSALVASNQPYSVSISSANPVLTSSTSSATIPSKSGLLNTNDNTWGIKLSTASTYEQITTTPKLFYSSSSPESKSLPFTIGISTAPDLPNGEYSTDITITATQN